MKTLGEVLQLSAKFLSDKGVGSPRRMADELLSTLLNLPRIELYMQFDRPMEVFELDRYRDYIKRAATGEPWQYIVGEVEFYHCKIAVSPKVLIPRPETEILVSKVVEQIPDQPLTVWDLCCGSGCMGIALKKARPQWDIALSDISAEALAVARNNGERNGAAVQFFQGDLLQPFAGRKADVVVCNPPYIAESEYAGLDQSVKGFEPKTALISGTTGFEFYARLAQELPRHLNPGAKVFFEVGTGMGSRVLDLFTDPCWVKKSAERDWAGHDRFIFLEFQ
jgi:release factor glutamine methyltransferase